MTTFQTPYQGPEEVERRNYAALVDSLAGALDLRGGLSEAVEVVGYNTMSNHIASFLDLEAGLHSTLAVSTRVDAVAREVRTSRAGQCASSTEPDAGRRSALAVSIDAGTAPRGVRMTRDERRAQLLAAATDLFVNNGYHATVMDDIAEHAGVSKPVLYQHFPGKLELYLALLERHADELVDRVQAAIEETHDNWQRVRNAIGAYFDFVDGDGEAFRLVFESDLRNQPLVQAVVERMYTACVRAIAQAVVADAGLDPDRAWLVAVGVVGISEHGARYWLTRRHELPKEEAIALTVALAWKGLAGFPLQRQSVHDAEHESTTENVAANPSSVADLLLGICDGDPAAWDEIFRRYGKLVSTTVRAFRLQEADALDAVQMTWLQFAENAHRIQFPERLGGWLATTARRECLHILRQAKHIPSLADVTPDTIPDPSVNLEQHVVEADIARTLRKLVAELSPRRRTLVRMLFTDQPRSYAEVARTVGIPSGGIGPTRSRALRQLREYLAADKETPSQTER